MCKSFWILLFNQGWRKTYVNYGFLIHVSHHILTVGYKSYCFTQAVFISHKTRTGLLYLTDIDVIFAHTINLVGEIFTVIKAILLTMNRIESKW